MTRAVHSAHPPVQEAGLADGCPACEEIALDPTAHLDDETLAQLAALAVSDDRLDRGRSETELVAAANVLSTLERVGRLASTAPGVVAWYLRERWRVDVLEVPDPACTCGHRLSEHGETVEADPADAGACRATDQGEDGNEPCPCEGFTARDA